MFICICSLHHHYQIGLMHDEGLFKITFFLFYLVSDIFNAFPQPLLSCIYQFLPYRPFSNDEQRFHCIWSCGGWNTHHTCELLQAM